MAEAPPIRLERTVVVVTALPVELAAIIGRLTGRRSERHKKGSIYEMGVFDSPTVRWRICVAEVGSGNAAAAMETERALAHFNPAYVFFVGIAGGVKDVALGDVVVASKVCRYESGADGASFLVRPDTQEPLYTIRERARALVRRLNDERVDGAPKIFLGSVAAGEKVVKSSASATAKFLAASYNDVLAVEMEGAGFFEAAHANGDVAAMLIRGISDLLDGKAESDGAGWQEKAAAAAADFLFRFLDELAAGQQRGIPQYVPLGGQPVSTAYEIRSNSIRLVMLDPAGHRVRYTKRSMLRVLVNSVQSFADDLTTDGRIEAVSAQPFEAEYVVVEGNRYLVLCRHPQILTAGQEVERELTCEWVDSFRNEQEYFGFDPPLAEEVLEFEVEFPAGRHSTEIGLVDSSSGATLQGTHQIDTEILPDGSQRVRVSIVKPRQLGVTGIRVQWRW